MIMTPKNACKAIPILLWLCRFPFCSVYLPFLFVLTPPTTGAARKHTSRDTNYKHMDTEFANRSKPLS